LNSQIPGLKAEDLLGYNEDGKNDDDDEDERSSMH
jgi:hypothetical protein